MIASIVRGLGKGHLAMIVSATPYTYEARVIGGRYDGCLWTFNTRDLKIN